MRGRLVCWLFKWNNKKLKEKITTLRDIFHAKSRLFLLQKKKDVREVTMQIVGEVIEKLMGDSYHSDYIRDQHYLSPVRKISAEALVMGKLLKERRQQPTCDTLNRILHQSFWNKSVTLCDSANPTNCCPDLVRDVGAFYRIDPCFSLATVITFDA